MGAQQGISLEVGAQQALVARSWTVRQRGSGPLRAWEKKWTSWGPTQAPWARSSSASAVVPPFCTPAMPKSKVVFVASASAAAGSNRCIPSRLRRFKEKGNQVT